MKDKIKYYIAIVFAIVAYTALFTKSDYLFALQYHSLFVKGHIFMATTLNNPGGLWTWIGCYLTQFFYHPWLGALILVGIWVATYFFLSSILKLKSYWNLVAVFPVAIQLFAILSLGYYIYYCKQPGYAFAQATSILAITILALIASIVTSYFLKKKNLSAAKYLAIDTCILIVATIIIRPVFRVYSWELPSKTFYSELKMYHAIDECRWDDVLAEAQECDNPTNLMVIYKNIALMHTDRLTDMFMINNCGTAPTVPDSLNVHISQLGAPMIYYQFGQINYAYRWAIENSVEYGTSINNMKILVRCAILNHEFDVARKYTAILKRTAYYRDWAKQQEDNIRYSSNLIKTQEFQNIAPLINEDANRLDVDNGLCEKWILNHFSDIIHPTSRKLEDVIMCIALWAEDSYSYCIHFYNYVNRHPNENIPLLYQEAAILLCSQKESPIDLNNYQFDNIITDQFNNFVRDYNDLSKLGLDSEEMGRRLKPIYGKTYWWYYYFYTDFNIY
ncbi:MAG: DUF6057 family protein [Bacteroidaceae bacterium]|nr:DUF6057 family protein [Bacteroidaceae bacterium]